MSILDEIVKSVRLRVQERKKEKPIEEMEIESNGRRSLTGRIESNSGISVIGELKQSSPSSGVIREEFRPQELAKSIVDGGAAGISVLTEPNYFGGKLNYLREVSASVEIPVLRKDFIVEEYQLYQSSAMDSDAVLLIAEILGEDLPRFVSLTRELGMEPLVEVGNKEQIGLAADVGANLIGINNRDLNSMMIDLSRTEDILKSAEGDFLTISESGIKDRTDVRRVMEKGADAVLVGTAVMSSDNVQEKVRSLRGVKDG